MENTTNKSAIKTTSNVVKNTVATSTKAIEKDSNKIKASALALNAQIKTSASEVMGEVKGMSQEVKVVANNIKEASEKVDFKASAEKIKDTVSAVNTQIKEATIEIVSEVKEASTEIVAEVKELGQEMKALASNGIKEAAEKIDFKASAEKIKITSANVNKQVKETAQIVLEEVKEKSIEMKETTVKLAKEAIENIKLNDRLTAIKQAVSNTNEYALNASEGLIDTIELNAEKWQAVAEKAIKTGVKLSEKQQHIVFSTLEAVKTQVGGTALRFKKLFAK